MDPSYHYRIEVATGYAEEVRALIELHANIASHNDGWIAADGNDTTVLAVVANDFAGLPGLKDWGDAHPAEELYLVSAVGTPFLVRETNLASLQAAVETHPELEPRLLEALPFGSAWRFEWRYTRGRG